MVSYIQIAQKIIKSGKMNNSKKVEDQFFDSFMIELVKLEWSKKKATKSSKVDK